MRGVNMMLNLTGTGRASRLAKALLGSLMALCFLSGLAWGADAGNTLTTVAMDSGADTPTVLIETAEPVGYRYTVYDSVDPMRVVVDFPDMAISDVDEVIAVDQGAIQEVKVSPVELASGPLARVEILLAESAEYQVNLEGQSFRVAFAGAPAAAMTVAETEMAPAAEATAADLLDDVRIAPGQATIATNGEIDSFRYFVLNNPARLVVNVYGVKPAFAERSLPVDGVFKQVRIGVYDDMTRLVFDAAGSALPDIQVDDLGSNLQVSWSDMPAASAVAQKSPAPAMAKVQVEAIDFINQDGRSVVAVQLSGPARVTGPVAEDNLVRFEIVNASLTRALRRTFDASAFPSAVTAVTPYTVTDGDHQNVRIAVYLKGTVPFALEEMQDSVQLVIDDGVYAEPAPPAVSQVKVPVPVMTESTAPERAEQVAAPIKEPRTADEMAAEAARYTGEKITLVFDSANIRSILQLIGDVSGLNILASSDVSGTITLRLIDVPWDQALDLVLETANLGKLQQGNVLRIMPKERLREIEKEAMQEQTVAIEEGILETRTFLISYASVDDMKTFLNDIKTERGSIIADSRNKQLIVRESVAVLDEMEEMIKQIDKPERQVMIEARIVEANTNFARNLGVKWNFDYNDNKTANFDDKSFTVPEAAMGLGGSFILPVTNPAVAGLASSITFGALDGQLDIDLRLAALENSGEGRIVSTPKITTLNGEKATISQGTKIPYSSVSDQGTDVQFENAELKLDVTPEINPDGSIILDIQASNSSVGQIVPTATGDAVSIEEKKAETKVLVHNGQTTVIGGIFIENENESQSGVPVLKDVPVFGHLFKSTTKSKERRELLIFITPRIVEG